MKKTKEDSEKDKKKDLKWPDDFKRFGTNVKPKKSK